MKFYHGTSEDNWNKIIEEGILYGKRVVYKKDGAISSEFKPSRCTYLAVDLEEAKQYGDVILEVEYDVVKSKHHNYFDKDCWQIRVYEPIDIKNIKRII